MLFSKTLLKVQMKCFLFPNLKEQVHVQNFWGVASRNPSLQATLPPSPQIF